MTRRTAVTGFVVLAVTLATATSMSCMAAEEDNSDTKELRRIAGLRGTAQQEALRSFLADLNGDDNNFVGRIFYFEDQLRPSLRALIDDPKLGYLSVNLLALVGAQGDLDLILRRLDTSGSTNSDHDWVYAVACALLQPNSETEWQFLRRAVLNVYDAQWADAGAIQTLKLLASDRSRSILEEASQRNLQRGMLISKALEYINSNPAPMVDSKLERLATRVAEAVKVGQWVGNDKPRYNRARDKAIVDCVFIAGRDRLTYTATFHHKHGVWELKGVRETSQALMPAPPVPWSSRQR